MKIFLAGTSSREFLFRDEMPKPLYILESFYYVQEWQMKRMHEWEMFLLDSGAFTFMANSKTTVDFDDYLEKYINFINKYDIKYFFELDIDSVVGLDEVERLRKRLEEGTGKKCIPVWHFSRGKDYFIKMCQEYDYVAFGGILTDGISRKDIYKYLPWFVNTAHKYGAQIHGLGLTPKEIESFGLDSVDSTSWLSASRYGQVQYFNGTHMKQHKRKENTKMKHYKILDDFVWQEWIKYQKYADKFL